MTIQKLQEANKIQYTIQNFESLKTYVSDKFSGFVFTNASSSRNFNDFCINDDDQIQINETLRKTLISMLDKKISAAEIAFKKL